MKWTICKRPILYVMFMDLFLVILCILVGRYNTIISSIVSMILIVRINKSVLIKVTDIKRVDKVLIKVSSIVSIITIVIYTYYVQFNKAMDTIKL